MACFLVTLSSAKASTGDETTESVEHADAYQQEGPMTTFFRTREDRGVIDSWSTRQASFRTADIVAVRRVEQPTLVVQPEHTLLATA